MSIIGLRFRRMAARIKVLSLNHPDLAVEKVRLVISDRLTGIVDTALPAVTRYTFLSLAYLLTSFHSLGCTS